MKRLALLCLLAAPGLAAADDGTEWYVTPSVGGISPSYHRDLKEHDWDYNLAVGKELGPFINLEGNFNHANHIGDGFGRSYLRQDAYSLDVLGVFNRAGVIAPYLSIGAGVLSNQLTPDLADTNVKHFMAQTGVGLFIKLWQNSDRTSQLSLRPDIKARFDDPGHGNHVVDYIGTLGLQFDLAAAPAAAPPPPPPPPPVVVAPPPPPPAAAAAARGDRPL